MLWKIIQIGLFVVASEFFYQPDAINNPLVIGLVASAFVIFVTHLVCWLFSPVLWVRGVINRGRQIREVKKRTLRLKRIATFRMSE